MKCAEHRLTCSVLKRVYDDMGPPAPPRELARKASKPQGDDAKIPREVPEEKR